VRRLIIDCGRGTVLLKLTTDRHEASRGLSATADLPVYYQLSFTRPTNSSEHIAARNCPTAAQFRLRGVTLQVLKLVPATFYCQCAVDDETFDSSTQRRRLVT